MAFSQYDSVAYKKRQEDYEKRLAEKMREKMSKKEYERQKKSFMLGPPNVIENYDPKTSMRRGRLRTGSIYKDESPNSNDGKMSPALKDIFFRPIEVAPINPDKVMKNKTRRKDTPRSARYSAEGRRRTAKIYRKKKKKGAPETIRSKSAPGGRRKKRRKSRKNKRSKNRRGKKRKTRKRRKKRR